MPDQTLDLGRCEVCGSTVRLRVIRRMFGWGAGYNGVGARECLCFKCCCGLNHHYRIVMKEKELRLYLEREVQKKHA